MKETDHRGRQEGGDGLRQDAVSDEELMIRYQGGDTAALEELIQRQGRALFGFLQRSLGDKARAEDAYQEVFIRVIRGAAGYSPASRFTAWLYTIARNFCIDQARRQYFRVAESLDDFVSEESGTSCLDTVASDEPDPEENVRAAELAQALEKAIAALPPEQREVFLLRERAGLSFKEIARLTRAPLNTVKTRMHYALNCLRKVLVQQGFMGEDTP